MSKIILIVSTILLLSPVFSFAQITESEVLSEGVLFARYTDATKPTDPEEGLCIYNTDVKCLECFDGSQWESMCSSEQASGFYINSPNSCGQIDENGISVIDVINATCSSINFTCNTLADAVLYEIKVGSQPLQSDFNLISTANINFQINGYPTDGSTFWITVNMLNAANELIGQTTCSFTSQSSNNGGGGTPPGNGTDYAQIAANAEDWMCLETANEYLAEFLRQNPNVNYWNQDHAAQSIVAIGDPAITGSTININPTGGNDTGLIGTAIGQAGSGGVVDGGGAIFLINNLNINQAGVTLRNMILKPSVSSGTRAVILSSPDVTFLRVDLDLENKQYSIGIDVTNGADRFAFVESSIQNLFHGTSANGDMMRLSEGADDVYIVNNVFKHAIGISPPNSNLTVRGIRVGSTNVGVTPKGGIIASNLFEDLQATGTGDDADAVVCQGFDLNNQYQIGFRMAFMANVGINCGKRLLKLQSGGVDAHSNVNHWRDYTGELGERVTRCHYDNLGTSNTRWTNNLGITDQSNINSENFFMQMQTHRYSSDFNTENIVWSCNKYIHNDDTSSGRAPYAYFIVDFNDSANGFEWPSNSYIRDNIVEGTGTFRFVWWFKFGNDPFGMNFDHLQNQITTNYAGLYRPN